MGGGLFYDKMLLMRGSSTKAAEAEEWPHPHTQPQQITSGNTSTYLWLKIMINKIIFVLSFSYMIKEQTVKHIQNA